jgi:hypothetical protein
MPGTFDVRIDNVQLEGPTPLLLDDFESGTLENSLGGYFWGGSQDNVTSLTIDAPGAGGSGLAAHLTGQVVLGDWALMQTMLNAAGTPVDVSAYTGISFDVLATTQFYLAGATGLVPQQSGNGICPLDANQIPTTSCGIDDGQLFPPFTDGYAGTAPDRGAFESGEPRWTSGAFFTQQTDSCTPPPDTPFTLPPAGTYPVSADSGSDAGGGDAGTDGSTAIIDEPAADTGCACTLASGPHANSDGSIGGLLGSLVGVSILRRRRRRCHRT